MSIYTPGAIDPKKLEEYLNTSLNFREREKNFKIAKEEAFLNGYTEAIENIRKIIHSCNCEKDEEASK